MPILVEGTKEALELPSIPYPQEIMNQTPNCIPGNLKIWGTSGLGRYRDGDLYHEPVQYTHLAATKVRWILEHDSGFFTNLEVMVTTVQIGLYWGKSAQLSAHL